MTKILKVVLCLVTISLFTIPSLALGHDVTIRTDHESRDFVHPGWRYKTGFQMRKIDSRQISKARMVVTSFSSRYDERLLRKSLASVNIVKDFRIGKSIYSGTYWKNKIILKVPRAHSIYYLERVLHHEYSSILLRKYPLSRSDKRLWSRNSARYGGRKLRDYYLRNGKGSRTERKSLLRQGFLTPYSATTFENDFNILAEYIFMKPERFKYLARIYPRIRVKRAIAIKYYCKLGAKIKCN